MRSAAATGVGGSVTSFGNVTVELLVILNGRKGDTVNDAEGAESAHKKQSFLLFYKIFQYFTQIFDDVWNFKAVLIHF